MILLHFFAGCLITLMNLAQTNSIVEKVNLVAARKDENKAVALVQSALSAAGNYEAIHTIKIRTSRLNYNKWQNYNFFHPHPTNDEAYVQQNFKDKKVFIKTVARYGGGYKFEFATIAADTTRYLYDINQSRNGKQLAKSGKPAAESSFQFINFFLPYYTLKTILASKDSLSIRVEKQEKIVTRHLANGNRHDFYFSHQTRHLTKWVVLQPASRVTTMYDNYVSKFGISFPQKIRSYINDDLVSIDMLDLPVINQPLDTALFQLPKDYVLTAPKKLEMKVSNIGKDVYLIENVTGGRNILFVNMRSGIFVTEAPLNSETSKNIIALIHKTIPGKPIQYVHISHFHNDHSNGIRAFVHEGATIITTGATAKVLRTIISDSISYKDDLATSRRLPKFQLFNSKIELTDEVNTIALYPIRTTHAKGMSFIHLPKAGIVYQGDLYSLPDDKTITPAIEITRTFYKFLGDHKIRFSRMVGHHGASDISDSILEEAMTLREGK